MSAASILVPRPLTRDAFAPYGTVLDIADGVPETRLINQGACVRHHALAAVEALGEGASVVVNLFRTEPIHRPFALRMMERHPLGSQAFWPLSGRKWLAAVAPDVRGQPGRPEVFIIRADQGVCYAPNVWHHPLMALDTVCDFLVVDRDGPGNNLEEASYDEPWTLALESLPASSP